MAEDEASRAWERRDPDDILAAMTSGEPYTSGELSEELGWPRRTVHHILGELEESGDVRRKKPDRTVIWMLAGKE